MINNLTTKEFKNKFIGLNNDFNFTTPIVIDFYASWCMPCKISAPLVEEISERYTNIEFYKVDVDKESDLATKFGVRSIPTFIFINAKGHISSEVGWIGENNFENKLKTIL